MLRPSLLLVGNDPVDGSDDLRHGSCAVVARNLDAHEPCVRHAAGHVVSSAGNDASDVAAVTVGVEILILGIGVFTQVWSVDYLARRVKAVHRRDAGINDGDVNTLSGPISGRTT